MMRKSHHKMGAPSCTSECKHNICGVCNRDYEIYQKLGPNNLPPQYSLAGMCDVVFKDKTERRELSKAGAWNLEHGGLFEHYLKG
jgi:hypothetical protein